MTTITETAVDAGLGPAFDAIDATRLLELRAQSDSLRAELVAITADTLRPIISRAAMFDREVNRLRDVAEARLVSWMEGAHEDDSDLKQALTDIVRIVAGQTQLWAAFSDFADQVDPDRVFVELPEEDEG